MKKIIKQQKQEIDMPGMTTTKLSHPDLTIRRARNSEWQKEKSLSKPHNSEWESAPKIIGNIKFT